VLKRLVESAFLMCKKAQNVYSLTSSGIAVFHDLTVEKNKSENLAALTLLVNEMVQQCEMKAKEPDNVKCLSGREIVDWLVKNSEVRGRRGKCRFCFL